MDVRAKKTAAWKLRIKPCEGLIQNREKVRPMMSFSVTQPTIA